MQARPPLSFSELFLRSSSYHILNCSPLVTFKGTERLLNISLFESDRTPGSRYALMPDVCGKMTLFFLLVRNVRSSGPSRHPQKLDDPPT